MKTKISIITGFLIGAALLFFAFRSVDFTGLLAVYSKANALFIIPFAFTVFLELFFRAARWRLLLNPSKPVRLWDAFRLEAAGLALNNILPLRLGEIARGTLGAKIFGIPTLTVFATILVERALDIIVLFLMFAAAACFGGITGGFLNYGQWLWALFAGLVAAMAALVFADELIAHRWFSDFFSRFPAVRRFFERVAMGVKGFHSLKSGALIFVFAFLQWFLDVFNYYLMALAFDLEGVIDIFKAVALLFTGAAAASMPGPPGYFGNFEFALAKVLERYGIGGETALAYASYTHMLGYILVTLLGVFFVYQMGHSLGKVWGEFSGKETKKIQD